MSKEKTQENTFSDRLRSLMSQRGFSQGDLGKALGTTQSTVSGWLNRGSLPRGELLIKIASFFGVKVAWLTYGTGPPESEFAVRLREALSAREVALTTVALETGVSEEELSAALAGTRSLSRVSALKLAEFLKVSYSWLVLGDGQRDEFDFQDKPKEGNEGAARGPLTSQLFEAVVLSSSKVQAAEIVGERLERAEAEGKGLSLEEVKLLRFIHSYAFAPEKPVDGSNKIR